MFRVTTTLRGRLTIWYTLVLGLMLVAFAFVADSALTRILITRTDYFIADGVGGFAAGLFGEMREHLDTKAAIDDAFREVRFPELRVLLLTDSLRVVGRSVIAGGPSPAPIGGSGASAQASHHAPGGSHPFLVNDVVAHLRTLGAAERDAAAFTDSRGDFRINVRPVLLADTAFFLVGAYPLDEVHAVVTLVRRFYLIVIPLLLIVAAFGGQLLARRSLSPLTEMVKRADHISEVTLHERLPVATPGDELGLLATVVNRLLGRLDEAFANQRRFMADASHELRTPLAILQSEAEITLSRQDRTIEEYRASAKVLHAATQRMDRIVTELFLMSRADAGHLTMRQDAVDLEEVVNDTVRAARRIASQRGVHVELRPLIAAPVEGDADLLGGLVMNLVDNAVRHTPQNGTVVVELAERGPSYEIRVTDNGEGIPHDAQPHIFERFFRVDSARSRSESSSTSGAGLGLAISRWIATAHGGSLDLVHSEPGRTEFCATIPGERL